MAVDLREQAVFQEKNVDFKCIVQFQKLRARLGP